MEVGEVRDLLSALEQSLQSVQVMRDELGKQYNENQKEAKQFELDLLTDDDLRNKLERHTVAVQLGRRAAQAGAVRQRLQQPDLAGHRPAQDPAAARSGPGPG